MYIHAYTFSFLNTQWSYTILLICITFQGV